VVVEILDFIDKPLKEDVGRDRSPSLGSSSSESVASRKGVEYVKIKLPKLVAEVNLRYKKLKDKFD